MKKIHETNIRNNKKDKNGITLIALIVTIVVMLILVGVGTSTIMGEGGLLNKSQTAAKETEKNEALEDLKIKIMQLEIDKKGTATLKDLIDSLNADIENEYIILLDKTATIKGTIPELNDEKEIYIVYKDYKFKVDTNLIVTFVGDFEEEKYENKEYLDEILNYIEENFEEKVNFYDILDSETIAKKLEGPNLSSGSNVLYSNQYPSFPAWYAFSDSQPRYNSNSASDWPYVGYDFQKKVTVCKVYINNYSSDTTAIKTFDIQYSDDNINWENANTQTYTIEQDGKKYFDLNTDKYARYWRIKILSNYGYGGKNCSINRIKFFTIDARTGY